MTTPFRFALASASFRVGGLADNARKMAQWAEQARDQGAQLIVFPELALTGYPPEDLLLRPALAPRIDAALAPLLAVRDIVMVVGLPTIHEGQRFNSAAIVYQGQLHGLYHKQFLPNYSVFDERRYFEAGNRSLCFDFQGQRLGLLVCEDVWHDAPLAALRAEGAQLVLVLNASPYAVDKHALRQQRLQAAAQRHGLPIAYVNLVGGQDDLVFDGGALAVNADGSVAVETPRFREELALLEFAGSTLQPQPRPAPLAPMAELYQALVMGVRDYVNHSGFKGVVLGLSGGIDSALVLAIAVDALGADRVHAVMMPYTYTAQISVEDAAKQAKRLGVHFRICEIHGIVDGFLQALTPFFAGTAADTTEENLQARARGTVLMALSNKFGLLVLTTGNKSEMAVGYATLYGDMAGGFDVLKDVYKTQVFALAKWRNQQPGGPVIPSRVITRPPSAELRPDQTDQDSLPPYEVLDAILQGYIEQDQDFESLVAAGFSPEVVRRVLQLVDRNEYKRYQSAPGPRVSNRAFGRERRYPLVNAWTIES